MTGIESMNLCWKKRLKFHLKTLLGPYINSLAVRGATKNQHDFFSNLPACVCKCMQRYREPFHKEASENKSVLSVLKWNVLFALVNQSACCIFALQFYCQQWYNLPSLCIDPCTEPRILDEGKRYHIVKVNVRNAEPFEELDVSPERAYIFPISHSIKSNWVSDVFRRGSNSFLG